MDAVQDYEAERWSDLDTLLLRGGPLTGPGFEPGPELKSMLMEDIKVLVIGAGGLGCELLKDLALSGFRNIDVIDMDTIDVSNLNRQFLFRTTDVGQSKAIVAARKVNERVEGVRVTPHFCRIEDKPHDFYREFHLIVLGLDSLEARSWINAVAVGFLEYDEDGSPDLSTMKPLVDGGTEGFKGHARVILPGLTPCFHCTLWLFPPQTTYPLCTLAETPRSPAHCIEYAHLIQWASERGGLAFDADDPGHVQWVFAQAAERAGKYGIAGVTLTLTQGVVKNIIPAIPSTNAVVAAACALEALKLATMCSKGLSNYMMYSGTRGVYTHTLAHERDPECLVCCPGVPLAMPQGDCTLQDVIDALMADPRFAGRLTAPSVSFQAENLYLRGALEEITRPNLSRRMADLMGGATSGVLTVNDKKLVGPLRVRLTLRNAMES